jgi:hypothetical protein
MNDANAAGERPGNVKPIDNRLPRFRALSSAWREWASAEVVQWNAVTFVTLNFKLKVATDGGHPISLDEPAARREVMKVGNRLDRAIYRNAVQRFNKRVRRIPFLEHGEDRGWHCHMVIEQPVGMLDVRFAQIVEESWSRSDWSSGLPDIRSAEPNVVGYLTKYRSKSEMESWSDTIILEAVVAGTKYPTSPAPLIC